MAKHPITLTSMKKTKKAKTALADSMVEENSYPYGLEIELDDSCLQKLGISDLPEAGEALALHANVKVSRSSSTDTQSGGKRKSLSLQIVEMGLESKDSKGTSEKLYG